MEKMTKQEQQNLQVSSVDGGGADSSSVSERKKIVDELNSLIESFASDPDVQVDELNALLDILKSFKADLPSGSTSESGLQEPVEVIYNLIPQGVYSPFFEGLINPMFRGIKNPPYCYWNRDKKYEKEGKNKRKCRRCGNLAFHDSRNCPTKFIPEM